MAIELQARKEIQTEYTGNMKQQQGANAKQFFCLLPEEGELVLHEEVAVCPRIWLEGWLRLLLSPWWCWVLEACSTLLCSQYRFCYWLFSGNRDFGLFVSFVHSFSTTHIAVILVPYSFLVFYYWRRGLSRGKRATTARSTHVPTCLQYLIVVSTLISLIAYIIEHLFKCLFPFSLIRCW